ncbi:MAG: hypothetical protein DK841_01610 [Candidatus Melainabacteria bacterium]|jgi:hypothetical protein|nr:MAG: hypothetical protein DK841_01610 [Candidatus Melainabacteria bacterium]
MVDNRSAGFFGIGGAFNFKSGDISGTAAKLSDDKMGQGGEYFSQRGQEEEQQAPANQYMDQSAVLRATLNSLAMMNVANVINAKKRKPVMDEEDKITEDLKEILRVKKLQNQQNRKHKDEEFEE